MPAVLGLGAVLALANAAAAGSLREEAARRRDESYAQQMVQWLNRHGHEPTDSDLRSSSYLRKLWDAYRRVKGRYTQRDRDRQEDRRRQQEWEQKKLEERAKREDQKARNLFAARRYLEAIDAFKRILNNSNYAAYHGEAKAKLDEMDQIGQDETNQAKQQAAAQDYEKAMNLYRSVLRRFRGLPCTEAAAKELKALNDSPEVQAKLKQARAAGILKRAEDAFAKKEYAAAASLYEMLMEAYADLDEGRTAKTKLEAIKADRKIWDAIVKERAEREATSLLALANSYITMGRGDRAVPRLTELIQKYPDSEHAAKAKALLAQCEEAAPAPAPAPAP